MGDSETRSVGRRFLLFAGAAALTAGGKAPAEAAPQNALASSDQTVFMPPSVERTFDTVAGYKTAHLPPKGDWNRDQADLEIGKQYRGFSIMKQGITADDIRAAEGSYNAASLRLLSWADAVKQASLMQNDVAKAKTLADWSALIIKIPAREVTSFDEYDSGSARIMSPLETLRAGKASCIPVALLNRAGLVAAGIPENRTALMGVHVTLPNDQIDSHTVVILKAGDGRDMVVDNTQSTVVGASAFFAKRSRLYEDVVNFRPVYAATSQGVQVYETSRRYNSKDEPRSASEAQAQIVSVEHFNAHDRKIYDRVMEQARALNDKLQSGSVWEIVPPQVQKSPAHTPANGGTSETSPVRKSAPSFTGR